MTKVNEKKMQEEIRHLENELNKLKKEHDQYYNQSVEFEIQKYHFLSCINKVKSSGTSRSSRTPPSLGSRTKSMT